MEAQDSMQLFIRCIHPNLDWQESEGPDYSTSYLAMTTLHEEYVLSLPRSLLSQIPFLESQIDPDLPLTIKFLHAADQLSADSIFQCIDCISSPSSLSITNENMLSLLYTSNYLQLSSIESYLTDFIRQNISAANIVSVSQTAYLTKNSSLLDTCYLFIRHILLYRSNLANLPSYIQDDKSLQYSSPYLQYNSSKLNLEIFQYKSLEISKKSLIFHEIVHSFNLMKIERTRSDLSIMGSDYPHTYKLIREHDRKQLLYAERHSDSGTFVICVKSNEEFGEDYVGALSNNFWGHEFTGFDHGVEKSEAFPPNFISERSQKIFIKFETNILGEKPRSLTVDFLDEENNEMMRLKNLPPKWSTVKECYTLNFYGRVSRASAKNFQLVSPDDVDTIYLMFGKFDTECFHLDYRSPLTMFQAFCIALAALARKRVVNSLKGPKRYMFSRQGRAINHLFPTYFAKPIKRPEPPDEDQPAVNEKKTVLSSSFKAVSREQYEHVNRDRTLSPRVTLYNPNWQMTRPRSAQGPRLKQKPSKVRNSKIFLPFCITNELEHNYPKVNKKEPPGSFLEKLKRTMSDYKEYAEKNQEKKEEFQPDLKANKIPLVDFDKQVDRKIAVKNGYEALGIETLDSLFYSKNKKVKSFLIQKTSPRKKLFETGLALFYDKCEDVLLKKTDSGYVEFGKMVDRKDNVVEQMIHTPEGPELLSFDKAFNMQSQVRGAVDIPLMSTVAPRDDMMYRINGMYSLNVPEIQSAESPVKPNGEASLKSLKLQLSQISK